MTDIHLDFVSERRVEKLCSSVLTLNPEILLVGGDIGTAENLTYILQVLETGLQLPIYFVLGNHDYYGSSIKKVREKVALLCRESQYLNWLPDVAPVLLGDGIYLLGHGCWADGRLGDYRGSEVMLTDFARIDELIGLGKGARLKKLKSLGDRSAQALNAQLKALSNRPCKKIIVLTHAPPFMEAAWHEGKICDKDWLPHMSCKAAGEVIKAHAMANPEQRILVLCGHTHSPGTAQILPNLEVRTGRAEYYRPEVQELITLVI